MHVRKVALRGGSSLSAALPASTALAATINGGPGNERLRGTNAADIIDGNGGNDRILGRGGDDQLIGGPGNDRVFGGSGNDAITGVQGNDFLIGGPGDDTVTGDAPGRGDLTSFDRLFGGAGNDTLRGGDSRDRIARRLRQRHRLRRGRQRPHGRRHGRRRPGRRRRQRPRSSPTAAWTRRSAATATTSCGRWPAPTSPAPGDQVGDTLDGGNGNDVFRTRDGEVDRITCGDGDDRALLDGFDVITDATAENPNGSCERVARKAPNPRDSALGGRRGGPGGAQPLRLR